MIPSLPSLPAVSEADLLDWSADIGSDCPVFFSLGAAYVTGRGENVQNVDPPLPLSTPLFLINPGVGLSTPEIFQAMSIEKGAAYVPPGGGPAPDPLDLLARLSSQGATPDVVRNDLETPAFAKLPQLAELKARLSQEGDFTSVFMTGSGSTMVGLGGAGKVPTFCTTEEEYAGMMQAQVRFITREEGEWFQPSEATLRARK